MYEESIKRECEVYKHRLLRQGWEEIANKRTQKEISSKSIIFYQVVTNNHILIALLQADRGFIGNHRASDLELYKYNSVKV